jgi:hypothetical protein
MTQKGHLKRILESKHDPLFLFEGNPLEIEKTKVMKAYQGTDGQVYYGDAIGPRIDLEVRARELPIGLYGIEMIVKSEIESKCFDRFVVYLK